jgi:UDP-N-acetylglucosamine:LPS N-acetylglucosamine transferase
MLIPVLASLKEKSIVSLGEPGERKTVHLGNCTIHNWLSSEDRANAMKNAGLVVFSGGHATCFEIVKYAKPSICVPTQLEQLANGLKLESLGCSLVSKDRVQLEVSMKIVQNQKNVFRANAETLREASNEFRGVEKATRIISNVLK